MSCITGNPRYPLSSQSVIFEKSCLFFFVGEEKLSWCDVGLKGGVNTDLAFLHSSVII